MLRFTMSGRVETRRRYCCLVCETAFYFGNRLLQSLHVVRRSPQLPGWRFIGRLRRTKSLSCVRIHDSKASKQYPCKTKLLLDCQLCVRGPAHGRCTNNRVFTRCLNLHICQAAHDTPDSAPLPTASIVVCSTERGTTLSVPAQCRIQLDNESSRLRSLLQLIDTVILPQSWPRLPPQCSSFNHHHLPNAHLPHQHQHHLPRRHHNRCHQRRHPHSQHKSHHRHIIVKLITFL